MRSRTDSNAIPSSEARLAGRRPRRSRDHSAVTFVSSTEMRMISLHFFLSEKKDCKKNQTQSKSQARPDRQEVYIHCNRHLINCVSAPTVRRHRYGAAKKKIYCTPLIVSRLRLVDLVKTNRSDNSRGALALQRDRLALLHYPLLLYLPVPSANPLVPSITPHKTGSNCTAMVLLAK
jgi:hypothetical protein